MVAIQTPLKQRNAKETKDLHIVGNSRRATINIRVARNVNNPQTLNGGEKSPYCFRFNNIADPLIEEKDTVLNIGTQKENEEYFLSFCTC